MPFPQDEAQHSNNGDSFSVCVHSLCLDIAVLE